MFADDLKLYRIIQNPHDIETLQQDWNYISDWSKLWDYKEQCYASELKWQGQVHTLFILATNSNTLIYSTHLRTKRSRSMDHSNYDLRCALSLFSQQSKSSLAWIWSNVILNSYMSESSFIILFVQPDKHIWSTVP